VASAQARHLRPDSEEADVNHDILMGRIAPAIGDRRVLHLIGNYLRRGAMVDGLVEASVEGTPQGGPLSPVAGQHLPGCARQGTGAKRAPFLPVCG
jgi:hypothetical protein